MGKEDLSTHPSRLNPMDIADQHVRHLRVLGLALTADVVMELTFNDNALPNFMILHTQVGTNFRHTFLNHSRKLTDNYTSDQFLYHGI